MQTSIFTDDGAEMVLVPEGNFVFGIGDDDLRDLAGSKSRAESFRKAYEEPRLQTLSLPSYYIDKYPVTNEQYRRFLSSTNYRKVPRKLDSSIWGSDRQPVVAIDLNDAKAYASWCGKRLPSEEQWEKAARGAEGRLFPWGDDLKERNCNSFEAGLECTSVVGSYPKGISPYGIHDMSGNVWELTTGQWDNELPAMRGGCYLTYLQFCRCTARWAPDREELREGAKWLGFRCVKDMNPIE
jgi:formylglycine-generating enzyme required for sulfatase activity